MRVEVRPFASADLPDVARLRALLYHHPDDDQLGWYASVWAWLERHTLAHDLHRWSLIADGALVGFLAAMPQRYRIAGQEIVAHTPTDFMVHPHFGFHAVSLMRTFFRTCPNCVTCDTSQPTIRLESWLGTKEVGELRHTAKLFNISVIPSPIPSPVQRLANRGLRVADSVLTRGTNAHMRVVALNTFDERFDKLFEDAAAVLPCLPEKDAAFLRWRYGPGSPHAETCVLGVAGEVGLLGYTVLRVIPTGRDGYILDLTTLPGRQDVAGVLLRQAVRHFMQAGVDLIRYRFLESPVAPRIGDLWSLGFFPRKRRHRLLVKFDDPAIQEVARDPAHWAYNAGDGELGFWVR